MENNAKDIASTVINELDHFQEKFEIVAGTQTILDTQSQLQSEPFVAAITATHNGGTPSLILICRNGTPTQLDPSTSGADYASYLSPLGRIVTKAPGQHHQFTVGDRFKNDYALVNKAQFTPKSVKGQWEAIDSRLEWAGSRTVIASLRPFLADEPEAPLAFTPRVKVELPSQAILDEKQDELFRLPINSRLRIAGAPGTGKTTVLLKRLSQKTKREFLSEEERALFGPDEWQEQDWILFTPSDLLKSYLKEALAKELLPADDDHVKVYPTFRGEVLREVGVLRVGKHGLFRAEIDEVISIDSPSDYQLLTSSFEAHLHSALLEHYSSEAMKFVATAESILEELESEAHHLIEKANDDFKKSTGDVIEERRTQQILRRLENSTEAARQIVEKIVRAGQAASFTGHDAVIEVFLQARSFRHTIELSISAGLPEDTPSSIRGLRSKVSEHAKSFAASMSIDRVLSQIPRAYRGFRTSSSFPQQLLAEGATDRIASRELGVSPIEQDLLLFVILRCSHSVLPELSTVISSLPRSIQSIVGRIRASVCIDEVTDFSPLEVACMELFAHPRRGGVTVAGDLMQRVTKHGLQAWSDLEVLSEPFHCADLNLSYRQTARLFNIAKDLYAHTTGNVPAFESARELSEADPPPLSFHATDGTTGVEWISERVFEIFDLCGQKLPSIAVLVPTCEDVLPLSEQLGPILRGSGIEIDASYDGRSLGDGSRVRIFPVEFIKGLEFEAVFYADIDRMAEIHQELVNQYFYVGLSRSRFFLGLTFSTSYPQSLDCIKHHFLDRETFQVPD